MSDAATSLRGLVNTGSSAYQLDLDSLGNNSFRRYSARLDDFRSAVNRSREIPADVKETIGRRVAAAQTSLRQALSDGQITSAERQRLVSEAGRIGGNIDAIRNVQAAKSSVPADTYRRIVGR